MIAWHARTAGLKWIAATAAIGLVLCASTSLPCAGAVAFAAQAKAPNEVQTHQLILEHDLEHERQMRQAMREGIDKRIDDLNGRITDVLTLVAIITTIGSLVAYFSAAQKARDAARAWMVEHADKLQTSLAEIEARAVEAERVAEAASLRGKEIDRLTLEARETISAAKTSGQGFMREIEETRSQVRARVERPISSLSSAPDPGNAEGASQPLSDAQRDALMEAEQKLREKPEAKYSATDWENRALAAYAEHDLDTAATYMRRAALAEDALPPQAAHFSVNRGMILGQVGRVVDEIATYDEVITRFESDSNPAVRAEVARALLNKGIALSRLDRRTDAIAIYEDIIQRYKDDAAPEMQESIAMAIGNKADDQGRMGQIEESLRTYDQLTTRFKDSTDPGVQRVLVWAMVNVSGRLVDNEDFARAITFAEKAIALANADSTRFSTFDIMAIGNKAEALARLGRNAEATTALDDALKRYGGASEAAVRDHLVALEFMRILTLGWSGRSTDAQSGFDMLIKEHEDSTNETVQELVAKARQFKTTPVAEWRYPQLVFKE